MTRYILRILLCLFLGVVTTVGVAWGFAWFAPPDIAWEKRIVWKVDEEFHGAFRDVWDEYFPSDRNNKRYPYWLSMTYNYGGLQYYAVHDFDVGRMHGMFLGLNLVRAGYPMKCMSYHYWTQFDGIVLLEHFDARFALFWKQPLTSKFNNDRVVDLPLRPIWPAFAINTFFYAMIWFILIIGWRAHMCVIRRWQGYCPMCKYDLRSKMDSGCPECGWNRTEMEKHKNEKMKKYGVEQ